jgi:ribosomal protein L24E
VESWFAWWLGHDNISSGHGNIGFVRGDNGFVRGDERKCKSTN